MGNDSDDLTDADTAPVPSKVFGTAPLLIDAEIDKRIIASRSPKIRKEIESHALKIGRRVLEVAILSACSELASNPSREKWEPGWVSIRDEAKSAEGAIRKTLRALDPNGKRARAFQLPISQARLGNKKSAGSLLRNQHRAKRDALILIAARKILAGLAVDSERRRVELIERLPARRLDVQKHAFVRALYEGWIFLMGVRPGSSTISEENPFLLFVEAAWQDWLGEDELWETPNRKTSFVRSLNLAQQAVSNVGVGSLIANGPSWL
jgi:hypothetical protein